TDISIGIIETPNDSEFMDDRYAPRTGHYFHLPTVKLSPARPSVELENTPMVSIHSLIHSLALLHSLTHAPHSTFSDITTRAACAARNAYTADGTRHHRIGEEAWRGKL
ncbi:hypothetical protein ALC60_13126, partial [Trachymyrmex zeteki]